MHYLMIKLILTATQETSAIIIPHFTFAEVEKLVLVHGDSMRWMELDSNPEWCDFRDSKESTLKIQTRV